MQELNNCEEIQEKLSPFIDGELSKNEILEVSEHLMECKECQEHYYSLKNLSLHVQSYFNAHSETITLKRNDINKIIFKAKLVHYTEMVASSVAVLAIFGALTWFSINTFESKFIQENNKEYVNAETYMMVSLLPQADNDFIR